MSLAWSWLFLALSLANGLQNLAKKQAQLWLDCSCLHANDRNATQWGSLVINASHTLGAKNNCLMIFIGGAADELVAFQLQQLQLRSGDLWISGAKQLHQSHQNDSEFYVIKIPCEGQY